MSTLAWRILKVLLESGKLEGHYLASWHIARRLDLQQSEFHWKHPNTEVDWAVRELIDRGLIKEMDDLGSRYQLIVQKGVSRA